MGRKMPSRIMSGSKDLEPISGREMDRSIFYFPAACCSLARRDPLTATAPSLHLWPRPSPIRRCAKGATANRAPARSTSRAARQSPSGKVLVCGQCATLHKASCLQLARKCCHLAQTMPVSYSDRGRYSGRARFGNERRVMRQAFRRSHYRKTGAMPTCTKPLRRRTLPRAAEPVLAAAGVVWFAEKEDSL